MTGARFKPRLPACQLGWPDDIVKSEKAARKKTASAWPCSPGDERSVMLPKQHARRAQGFLETFGCNGKNLKAGQCFSVVRPQGVSNAVALQPGCHHEQGSIE